MSEPRRAHKLLLDLQADSLEDLSGLLDEISHDLYRGVLPATRLGGGASRGYIIEYTHAPEWTHDRYFDAIRPTLRRSDPGVSG